MRGHWVALVVLLAGTAVLSAQEEGGGGGGRGAGGRGGRGNTREFLGLGRQPDPAVAARGEKLYLPSCGFCHGNEARGAEAPSLVRSEVVLHDDKGELIGPVLLKGRPDAGMPAFPNLTPAQIAEIAEFLHMKVEMAANRGMYGQIFSNRNAATGNAKAGEAYFNGAGGCQKCHSPTGDLAKIGSRMDSVNLQNRWVWPGAGGRGGRGGNANPVTIVLPSGQKVTGNLKKIDDFDVSIYDAEGRYRSWSRDQVKVERPDPMVEHRRLLDTYTDQIIHDVTAYLVTLK